MNQDDFVSYELAVKLKECGFDEPCDHYYARRGIIGNSFRLYDAYSGMKHQNSKYSTASAPTLAHAQKWLREKKKMHCQVLLNGVRSMYFWQVMELVDNGKYADSTHQYDVYEDAMGDCISAALELINKGK